ncbi:MAG: hypothetical protein R3E09_11925 [Novosphingobium sp.]
MRVDRGEKRDSRSVAEDPCDNAFDPTDVSQVERDGIAKVHPDQAVYHCSAGGEVPHFDLLLCCAGAQIAKEQQAVALGLSSLVFRHGRSELVE